MNIYKFFIIWIRKSNPTRDHDITLHIYDLTKPGMLIGQSWYSSYTAILTVYMNEKHVFYTSRVNIFLTKQSVASYSYSYSYTSYTGIL